MLSNKQGFHKKNLTFKQTLFNNIADRQQSVIYKSSAFVAFKLLGSKSIVAIQFSPKPLIEPLH